MNYSADHTILNIKVYFHRTIANCAFSHIQSHLCVSYHECFYQSNYLPAVAIKFIEQWVSWHKERKETAAFNSQIIIFIPRHTIVAGYYGFMLDLRLSSVRLFYVSGW